MAAILFHEPIFATVVESGDQLFVYDTGTTDDLTVYTDSALTTPHTQPIVADSEGRFAAIYIDSTGTTPKFVLQDLNSVEKWTVDPYPIQDLAALTASVTANSDAITALDGRLTTAEADIVVLDTESADYETRITALEGGAGAPGVQIFTGDGTYTKPAGLSLAKVTVIGGGGGGVNYSQSTCGGAGGGAAIKWIAAGDIGATEAVTVGLGGAGISGSPGNDGGSSSFGAHCSATGGSGGQSTATEPVEPGTGSNGDLNLDGYAPQLSSNAAFGHINYQGGGSFLGGSRVNGIPNTPGAGGAINLAAAGEDGADGIVIVEEFF